MVKRKNNRPARSNPAVEGKGTATGAPVSAAGTFLGVSVCFVLSGFAALLYQTAWMRQFAVEFGTSELAVATVLASYMSGLAAGAAVAGRFVHRVRRPVLVYAVLEGAIALSALAVPLLMDLAGSLYVFFLGGQPELPDASGIGQSLFYLTMGFVVLAVPTGCMGATLPLLTRFAVRSDAEIGPRVGLLYALNTIGAIGGTLVAAFVLLPRFSLQQTVLVGVFVNFVVFLVAAVLARAAPQDSPPSEPGPASQPEESDPGRRRWVLLIMMLSGINSFTYEVLWTRLLSHVLGGSINAFATMLAAFLGGIALGSAIASRFARNRSSALTGLVLCQLLIAVCSAAIYQMLPILVPDKVGLTGNAALAVFILMPATLFIGATFPFAVRLLASGRTDAARHTASVYAWNTAGAIAGAALAGFLLIPLLKYEGTIRWAVITNTTLALFAVLLVSPKQTVMLAISGLAALGAALLYHPPWPEQILRVSPVDPYRSGEVRYYDVGRSSTVLMLERDGYFYLRNNGLPEASVGLSGAPPSRHSQRMLTTLPVLARPETRSMLVIGFGGGVALEDMAPTLDQIDVLELEAKVIHANRRIADERAIDPLADSRVSVAINDVRSALSLTTKTYDAIVSQPSHPWTAGASHLYTREFMQLARSHLNSDGVLLQWMNSRFVDEDLLRALAATLLDVFPHVRLYQWDPQVLMFLASDAPLNIEQELVRAGLPLPQHRSHFQAKGVGGVEDLLVALAMDSEGLSRFSRGAELLTDERNRMATHSALVMQSSAALDYRALMQIITPYSPLLQADSWVHRDLPATLNFSYIGARLDALGARQLAVDFAEILARRKNPHGLAIASRFFTRTDDNKAIQTLVQALSWDPDFQHARFELAFRFAGAIAAGSAPQEVVDQIELLDDAARAVVRSWARARAGDHSLAQQLDAQLATAEPSDPWYLRALKLRADWRNQQAASASQKHYAREALELIDDGISLFQDLDFYGMRSAAAYLADDYQGYIETARRMVWLMRERVDRSEREGDVLLGPTVGAALRRLASISQGIELAAKQDVPAYKVEDLRGQIAALERRYQNLRQ